MGSGESTDPEVRWPDFNCCLTTSPLSLFPPALASEGGSPGNKNRNHRKDCCQDSWSTVLDKCLCSAVSCCCWSRFSLSVLYGCGSLPCYDILHDSAMLPWPRVPASSSSLRTSDILCWWQTAANSLAGLARGVSGCFCPRSIFYRRRLERFGSRNQYFSLEPLRALHPIACSTH